MAPVSLRARASATRPSPACAWRRWSCRARHPCRAAAIAQRDSAAWAGDASWLASNRTRERNSHRMRVPGRIAAQEDRLQIVEEAAPQWGRLDELMIADEEPAALGLVNLLAPHPRRKTPTPPTKPDSPPVSQPPPTH